MRTIHIANTTSIVSELFFNAKFELFPILTLSPIGHLDVSPLVPSISSRESGQSGFSELQCVLNWIGTAYKTKKKYKTKQRISIYIYF